MPFLKKRSQPSIKVKGLIIFFLFVVGLCIYTFYFLAPPSPKKPEYRPTPPAKIPPPLKVGDYSSLCRQINQKILLFFKERKWDERNIHILKEATRSNKKKKWIYTKIEIYLPRSINLLAIAENLAGELKNFPDITSQWELKEPNQALFSIWLAGTLTHSIRLLYLPPQLAIIIDDLGENLSLAKKFFALEIPLTFSILPGQTHSQVIEELAHNHNYEVMLHLPMEPKDRLNHNPGKGAVCVNMEENQILALIQNHLHKFRYIKGVNNHMGSRATENEATMRAVFNALKPTGLYFVDSRTSSQSKAYNIAKEMGIPAGKNLLFIDNETDVNYAKKYIDQGIQLAKRKGDAIIIGHPRETTLEALKEMIPELKEQGISLVFVSALVK